MKKVELWCGVVVVGFTTSLYGNQMAKILDLLFALGASCHIYYYRFTTTAIIINDDELRRGCRLSFKKERKVSNFSPWEFPKSLTISSFIVAVTSRCLTHTFIIKQFQFFLISFFFLQ